MKKLLVLLTLCLVGCASAPPAKQPDTSTPDPSAGVVVDDLRPTSEKEDKLFSAFLLSDGFGIYRKGDKAMDPSAIAVFRRMAFEALGDGVANAPITVHHLVIYENGKSAMRKNAFGMAVGGAIGGALASTGQDPTQTQASKSLADRAAFESGGKEYERAYFTQEENPHNASVIVVYLDASIAGKRIFVKTVSPVHAVKGENLDNLALRETVQFWLAQYSLPA